MSVILKLFFILSLFGAPAKAEMIIGAEFEFVDPRVRVLLQAHGLKGHEAGMAENLVEVILENCRAPQCTYKLMPGKYSKREYRFYLSPSDFWFQISTDPNVVEVQTKPLPLRQYKQLAPLIQSYIFDAAAEAGLEVDPAKRAGHFNFSAHAAFENRPDLLLRFMADFANRPELANGILRQTNLLNSPHFASLDPAQRDNFQNILQEFSNDSRSSPSTNTIAALSQRLLDKVFYKAPKRSNGAHYQALGIKRLPESSPTQDAPFEVRALRSQRNIEDFILMAELIEARIEYLKQLPADQALSYNMSTKVDFTPSELVSRFYIYTVEAGLPWQKFKNLLPSSIVDVPPSDFLVRNTAIIGIEKVQEILSYHELLPTSVWLQKRLSELIEKGLLQGFELQELQKGLWNQSLKLDSLKTFETLCSACQISFQFDVMPSF